MKMPFFYIKDGIHLFVSNFDYHRLLQIVS
jgi:hypothetical protein